MAYTKYSLTPADNNAAPPNGAPEGMLPSAVNDTMRDMMSQIRDVGDGIRGGTYTMTAPVITGGSISGASVSATSLTDSGNLTFTGTGNRILGDFSNATIANRVLFQNSTANANTEIGGIPNGTATATILNLYNSSDPSNAASFRIFTSATESRIGSVASGTAAHLPITMHTNGSERLRIDTSGNVLVNTPTARTGFFNATNTPRLQIEGTTFDTSSQSIVRNTDVGNAFLVLGRTRGTAVGSTTVVQNGDFTGGISFQGSDGTELVENARISGLVDGTPGANDMPGALVFSTTADGASSSTERMRIDSSGNVGIGTNSPNSLLDVRGSSPEFQVGQVGASNGVSLAWDNTNAFANINTTGAAWPIRFLQNSTERMRITAGGEVYIAGTTDQGAYNLQCNGTGVWGAGAYVNGSDERIKDNITPLDSGLDVVAKLNPVTYKYKEDWSKDQSTQTGFIAQELLTALEGKNYVDGVVQQGGQYMSVAYQNIIPILTKAIQELKAELDSVKAKLTALKA